MQIWAESSNAIKHALHLSTTSMINDLMTHMHDNVVTSSGEMHISPYHNSFILSICLKVFDLLPTLNKKYSRNDICVESCPCKGLTQAV
jgi:hypothetical protein